MYRYAYLIGDLILLIIWLFLFFFRRDLRREMIVMGLLMVFWLIIAGGWFVNIYLKDYWQPEYLGILGLDRLFSKIGLQVKGSEDALFIFFFSGIAAVLYEEVLGKRHFRKRRRNILLFALFPIIMFITLFIFASLRFMNIIYGEYLGYLLAASVIWLLRKDLFLDSLLSGLFLGLLFFLSYVLIFLPLFPGIVPSWWILHKTSGIFLLGVPLEEILWAFSFGLFVGPTYEFLMGLKEK